MKLRPQIQLRFRDMSQYEMTKEFASREGISLNEYVVRCLEDRGATPPLPQETRVRVRKGKGGDRPVVSESPAELVSGNHLAARGDATVPSGSEASPSKKSKNEMTAEHFFALSASD